MDSSAASAVNQEFFLFQGGAPDISPSSCAGVQTLMPKYKRQRLGRSPEQILLSILRSELTRYPLPICIVLPQAQSSVCSMTSAAGLTGPPVNKTSAPRNSKSWWLASSLRVRSEGLFSTKPTIVFGFCSYKNITDLPQNSSSCAGGATRSVPIMLTPIRQRAAVAFAFDLFAANCLTALANLVAFLTVAGT